MMPHHADNAIPRVTTAPVIARAWLIVLTSAFVVAALGAWLARRQLAGSWDPTGEWAYERTVLPHAAAMTAVVALVLLVTIPLRQAGLTALSLLVSAGAGFGTLSLLAAPVFTTPDTLDLGPSTAANMWPWVVGLVVTALLIGTSRTLSTGDSVAISPLSVIGITVTGVLMVLPLLVVALLPGNSNFVFPAFFPVGALLIVVGWALIGGGLIVAGYTAVDRPVMSGVRLLAAAAGLALGHWAYNRAGGAPGVPGWEYGVESPALISAPVTMVLLGSASAGLLLHVTRVGARLAGGPSTASPDDRPTLRLATR